ESSDGSAWHQRVRSAFRAEQQPADDAVNNVDADEGLAWRDRVKRAVDKSVARVRPDSSDQDSPSQKSASTVEDAQTTVSSNTTEVGTEPMSADVDLESATASGTGALRANVRLVESVAADDVDMPIVEASASLADILTETETETETDSTVQTPAKSRIRVRSVEDQERDRAVRERAGVNITRKIYENTDANEQDDLQVIYGIGPVMEGILHDLGIYTYRQLATLDEVQIEAVRDSIGTFRSRIDSDDWIGGARAAHVERYGDDV
ncbi:hypothetical protein OAS86_01515, partial [Gammaproteobacteria bacterium]|nr:hypothetical protein [Gammaproteobacteria bacterium]